jgi:phage recombination protein Bet
MKMENQIVKYVSNQMQIELNPEMVKSCLVRGDKNEVTPEEITLFMNLCAYRQLNPFLNEVYPVKYKGSPLQMITSQDVFINRANANPHYKGKDEGVIVQRGDTVASRPGEMVYAGEILLGGWCKVFRDDRDVPELKEVMLSEFLKTKFDGSPMSTWKTMPASMIVKVARSQALRQAFPAELSGLYSEAEGGTTYGNIIDITPAKEPVRMPQAKGQKDEEQATDLNETESDTIPKCPECGKKLAATEEKAAAVIEYCTKNNKPVQCYNCQHKK